MRVSKKLKRQIENFLYEYPHNEEYGGFLFSWRDIIIDFMVIPNMSQSPRDKFQPANNAFGLATKYAHSKRQYDLKAFWHSHPTPCIMSVADVTVANNLPYSGLFFVMITPKKEYDKDYVWYACKGIKPEEIDFV